MDISRLIPENQKEEEFKYIKRLSRAEVIEPYNTQRITKDGRIFNVWLTASSLVDCTNNVYAISTTERESEDKNKRK